MRLSDRLQTLAGQYAYASGIKEAARLRVQCSLGEWEQVVKEAKRIFFARKFDYTKV